MIGAIKSIIGHTEASSGLCSLIKTIMCFENELIPANLHMKKINHRIDGLVSGILQPIIENTPFKGKYIALNCFGFGGVNVHVVIGKHEKDAPETPLGELPRLINICGRNKETLDNIYNFMLANPDKLTADFLALVNDVSKTSPFWSKMFKGMRHRGFVVFDQHKKTISELTACKVKAKQRPAICFVYTGMGCQWNAMGEGLFKYPVAGESLQKCCDALKLIDSGFDLKEILTGKNADLLKSPLNCFVAIAAIQIALTDLLEHVGIQADYIVGHSIGELACAYADKCLTLQECIQAAYWRGKCIQDLETTGKGAMAAIGCSWEKAEELCQRFAPGKVWPACNNGEDSVTVSGLKEDIEKFLEDLQQHDGDLFARQVNSSGAAFHCPAVENVSISLLNRLSNLLDSPKDRIKSSKWLSTTYGPSEQSKFNASYLVDNLIKPVRFYEAFEKIPAETVYVEIAPHNLLQSIIKRNMANENGSTMSYVATLSRQSNGAEGNVSSLLKCLGLLYTTGLNVETEKLYPKVQYPVARGTASLNSFIQWKHDRKFTVTQYPEFFNQTKLYQNVTQFELNVSFCLFDLFSSLNNSKTYFAAPR